MDRDLITPSQTTLTQFELTTTSHGDVEAVATSRKAKVNNSVESTLKDAIAADPALFAWSRGSRNGEIRRQQLEKEKYETSDSEDDTGKTKAKRPRLSPKRKKPTFTMPPQCTQASKVRYITCEIYVAVESFSIRIVNLTHMIDLISILGRCPRNRRYNSFRDSE